MKTETTYDQVDLEEGECTSCLEKSDQILIGDTKCVECIEDQKFFDATMEAEEARTDDMGNPIY